MHPALVTFVAFALILAGTSLAGASGDCLPAAVTLDPASAEVAEGRPAPHGTAVVYVDDSLSMRGFVDPQAGQPAIFADTIAGLRQALEQVVSTGAVNMYSFGANIASQPLNDLLAATRPDFYACDPPRRSDGCESRIDKVLDAVARSGGDTLSILETDLFLSEKDMVGSEYGTMRTSFEKVLLSGKSVGILGISAPFHGAVYDIPAAPAAEPRRPAKGAKTRGQQNRGTAGKPIAAPVPARRPTFYNHHGERPFFLVIMGADDEQILRLKNKIETQILGALPAGAHHFALFTLHPPRNTTTALPLLLDARNEPVPTYMTLPASPRGIPVVRLAAKNPPIVRQEMDKIQQNPDTTLPLANFAISQQSVWAYADNILYCQSARWRPYQQPALMIVDSESAGPVLRFDKNRLRGMPAFTFLVRAKVNATAVKTLSARTRWLHDWGFAANPQSVETVLQSKPKLFPVLNLGQLGDTLEGIVTSDFKPVPVADYLFAFQKAD